MVDPLVSQGFHIHPSAFWNGDRVESFNSRPSANDCSSFASQPVGFRVVLFGLSYEQMDFRETTYLHTRNATAQAAIIIPIPYHTIPIRGPAYPDSCIIHIAKTTQPNPKTETPR